MVTPMGPGFNGTFASGLTNNPALNEIFNGVNQTQAGITPGNSFGGAGPYPPFPVGPLPSGTHFGGAGNMPIDTSFNPAFAGLAPGSSFGGAGNMPIDVGMNPAFW